MVTLQILVLPFLVRVRVSQLKASIFQRWMLFLYTINTLYYFFYVTLHGIGGLQPSIVKKNSEDFKKTSVYFNNI